MIDVEPLLETCDKCGGTGQTRPPPDPNAGASFGPRRLAYPEACPKCQGKGRVLTEIGRAVAEVYDHVRTHGH